MNSKILLTCGCFVWLSLSANSQSSAAVIRYLDTSAGGDGVYAWQRGQVQLTTGGNTRVIGNAAIDFAPPAGPPYADPWPHTNADLPGGLTAKAVITGPDNVGSGSITFDFAVDGKGPTPDSIFYWGNAIDFYDGEFTISIFDSNGDPLDYDTYLDRDFTFSAEGATTFDLLSETVSGNSGRYDTTGFNAGQNTGFVLLTPKLTGIQKIRVDFLTTHGDGEFQFGGLGHAIPEPSTMFLGLLSLGMLGIWRRRSFSRK